MYRRSAEELSKSNALDADNYHYFSHDTEGGTNGIARAIRWSGGKAKGSVCYPEKQHRVLRRFAFDLEPKSTGTLFSGFTETKHADIKAITYRDEGVEEYIIDGKGYSLKGDGEIDPIKLMELAGLG